MTDLLDQPLSRTWRIWWALIAPPLLWGARLLATWTVAEVACARGWASTTRYFAIQTAITAVAVGLAVFGGWAAWTALEGSPGRRHFDPSDPEGFLALTGVVSTLVFSLLMILEGSGVYLIGCG
ncbi:MAG: hypothetical protein ACLFWM_06835 [Actinomycetota bacterium]